MFLPGLCMDANITTYTTYLAAKVRWGRRMIIRWKVAGAPCSPKGRTPKCQYPLEVLKAVFSG